MPCASDANVEEFSSAVCEWGLQGSHGGSPGAVMPAMRMYVAAKEAPGVAESLCRSPKKLGKTK